MHPTCKQSGQYMPVVDVGAALLASYDYQLTRQQHKELPQCSTIRSPRSGHTDGSASELKRVSRCRQTRMISAYEVFTSVCQSAEG